jgi:hypothetical protein
MARSRGLGDVYKRQRKASTDLKTSLNDALRDFNVAI